MKHIEYEEEKISDWELKDMDQDNNSEFGDTIIINNWNYKL